jgi:hypothetical protein
MLRDQREMFQSGRTVKIQKEKKKHKLMQQKLKTYHVIELLNKNSQEKKKTSKPIDYFTFIV